MHYWNKANFIGLRSIGEACAQEFDVALFGQYCVLREQGLKKPALVAANAFVQHFTQLDVSEQRALALRLVDLQRCNSHVHQLLPHPIKGALIATLQKWCDENPIDPDPHRSLGVLTGDIACFEAALQIAPHDQISLVRVVHANLSDADFQTHHLGESRFIGAIADAQKSLLQAEELLPSVSDVTQRTSLSSEVEYYKSLISAWVRYSTGERTEPFNNWCQHHGLTFAFSKAYYYSNK
jgi:hypothetical protein